MFPCGSCQDQTRAEVYGNGPTTAHLMGSHDHRTQSALTQTREVLPWDLFPDGLVCPGGPTAIASPLCDVESDSNRQKPERQKFMCEL